MLFTDLFSYTIIYEQMTIQQTSLQNPRQTNCFAMVNTQATDILIIHSLVSYHRDKTEISFRFAGTRR